jgi:Uri superfamily endonuclease
MPARCSRHLAFNKPLRWHIDYLTRVQAPRQVWFSAPMPQSRLVAGLERYASLDQPLPEFGASDSKACSHLFSHARSRMWRS